MQEKSYQDLFSMASKVVIITGGSGYLGSALTDGFMAQGARVHCGGPGPPGGSQHPGQLRDTGAFPQ